MITYGSVCSGVESASVAWEPLGYRPLWFSEIEPFPSAVLAHHWPTVPNVGDMLALPFLIERQVFPAPDVLVGGTPCQAFSVAGMRAGLDDARGQLTIKYVEVLNAIDEQREEGDECVAVWENVPGVLSSKDNAFGCFLAALVGEEEPIQPAGAKWTHTGCVYGPQRAAAWRVLDAQYFGVAQRRRRVFVVTSARDGFDPAEILFEFDGVRRDTPPSREAGEDVAPTVTGGPPFSRTGNERVECEAVVVHASGAGYWKEGTGCLRAREQDSHENLVVAVRTAQTSANGHGIAENVSHTLDGANGQAVVVHGTQDPCVSDKAFALGRNNGQENVVVQGVTLHGSDKTVKAASFTEVAGSLTARPPGGIENSSTTVVFQQNTRVAAFSAGQSKDAGSIAYQEEQAPTLRGGASGTNQVPTLHLGAQVRRLMPVECERLQGFPDGHTLIPWRGKPASECPDGPRYKAIGNSKARPVVRWLGLRIKNYLEVGR